MVKCPRCGYKNPDSSVYCDNCAYPLSDESGKKVTMNKRKSSWNMGLGKKIVIVLGIIVIGYLLFTFAYNNSQPTKQDSLNIISDDGSLQQGSSYPYDVAIQYEGNWYAKMGDPNYLQEQSGYGSNTFKLDCSPWDKVYVSVYQYGGEGELTVQLLRNGKVVAENTTNETVNNVELTYN
ncbi:zinc ribbon domain-containing protein [Methanobrevibacter sp.]|uniref:zinc ribbon domain-containing protein n=1 Tax=Methanobrevibacter sp. TaxID=66852 RepID=UPI00388D4AAA